ncbi:hypothetical protein [Serratia ficaria]|uniref:hypothetical protein n=1 Tax=Serratia ficaria TaxID=61651 RepID=UPI0021B747BB|nr:hypothetical protein [Serratia ficaria]
MAIPRHYRHPDINRNRRSTLKERMKRLIDNTDLQGGQKAFLKQGLAAILQEYAELWECRNGKEAEK